MRIKNFLLIIFLVSGGLLLGVRAQAALLIIDHTSTNITAIPESAITQAKSNLHIAYGHTSHGSQLITGMNGLISFANNGGKGLDLPDNIFAWNNGGTGGALDLHDYAMGGDVGYYPAWVNNTRNYLGTPSATTGRGTGANADVNVIIWSWCGQAAGLTEQEMIDEYLVPMTQLELDYPGITFVYMTGHLDSTGTAGNLYARNEQIRQYVRDNNKVLYDFADIESYDPDGLVNYNPLMANDNCDYDSDGNGSLDRNWATVWQNSHTEGVDWYSCSSAHSQPLNANMKAYAAWHLWARLGGWEDSNTYYVDQNHPQASDSNPGTENLPWLTIQHAANTAVAGDTVYVNSGVYNERVSSVNSGTTESPITFKAQGSVSMQGFEISGEDYIKIIGFEITNTSYNGILLEYTQGCEIWDNYIHDTGNFGVFLQYSGGTYPSGTEPVNILVKGNTFEFNWGGSAIQVEGSNSIFEYNDISYQDDSFNLWGNNNIIRNNYFHDSSEEYYPGAHNDIVQTYTNTHLLPIRNALIENNYINRNIGPDAHGLMARDPNNISDENIIFRRNILTDIGSMGVYALTNMSNVKVFNNQFHDICNSGVSMPAIGFQSNSPGGRVINNIFYDSSQLIGRNDYSVIGDDSLPGFEADYNLTYLSGNMGYDVNGLRGQNPLFIDPVGGDFHMQGTSPAVGTAGPLTTVIASGVGTSIELDDARYFSDGWGITYGDMVKIGSNNPVRVSSVNYSTNIITVENSISFTAGDWVNLSYTGQSLDRGAFEYNSSGYDFNISITTPLNNAVVSESVIVTASVSNSSQVRHVVFFVNGIPQETDNEAPYSFSLNTSNFEDGNYIIEARAYSLYASDNLWESDQITINIGSDIESPSIPVNLSGEVISETEIDLSWTASTDDVGVYGYRIYRDGSRIATSPTNSYSDTGLTASTTYIYAVSAYDVAGNVSASSSPVSVITVLGADTIPPTGSVLINSGASYTNDILTTLTLIASDISGVTQMVISNTNIFDALTAVAFSSPLSWTLSAVDGVRTVYVWFKDSFNNWNSTPFFDAISLDRAAANITGIFVSNISTDSAAITWTTSEPSVTYLDYGLTSAYGQTTTEETSYATAHTIMLSGLSASTTYNFRINASDRAGNQSFSINQIFETASSSVSDIIPPAKITDLSSSNILETSGYLHWTATGDDNNVGLAKSYELRYSTTFIADGSTQVDSWWNSATPITQTMTPKISGQAEIFHVLGLTAQTTYYFALQTIDEANNSSFISNIINFTTPAAAVVAPPPSGGGGGGGSSSWNPPSSGAITNTSGTEAPTNFIALGAKNQIYLQWVNPINSTFAGVKLYRKIGSAISSQADSQGKLIYDGTEERFNDLNLVAGNQYFYTLYAYDRDLKYSLPKIVSATLDQTRETIDLPQAEIVPTNSNVSNQNNQAKKTSLIGVKSSEVEIITKAESQTLREDAQNVPLSAVTLAIYKKIIILATKEISQENKYAIASFIHYGTPTTVIIGAGERGGSIASFHSAFGRLPETEIDWQDVIKIANGRWPTQRNVSAQYRAQGGTFVQIYGRDADLKNENDDAAVTIIVYGLRPAQRNLNSEKAAILSFKYVYKKNPVSAEEWDIVRAIAYSGAKR